MSAGAIGAIGSKPRNRIPEWIFPAVMIAILAIGAVSLGVIYLQSTPSAIATANFSSAADGNPCHHPEGKLLCEKLNIYGINNETRGAVEWMDSKVIQFRMQRNFSLSARGFVNACVANFGSGVTIEIVGTIRFFKYFFDEIILIAAEYGITGEIVGDTLRLIMP